MHIPAMLLVLASGFDPTSDPLHWQQPLSGMTDGAISHRFFSACDDPRCKRLESEAIRRKVEQALRQLEADAEMNATIEAYRREQAQPPGPAGADPDLAPDSDG